MAGGRGGRGAPPMRGARGGRGMPNRGGLNQSVQPISNPIFEKQDSNNANSQQDDEDENNEGAKQQPAIQVPIENNQLDQNDENQDEVPVQREDDQIKTSPFQEQPHEEINNNDQSNTNSEHQDSSLPSNMPKTSHRRGQPAPGNHNAPPPQAIRPTRDVPGVRGRGGRPPNTHQRSTPPSHTTRKPQETVQIEEDEIVHEGSQRTGHVDSAQASNGESHNNEVSPVFNASKPKQDQSDFNIIENENYEESENKNREVKEMFGKMFDNDASDQDNQSKDRSRGRSPNFSEQRFSPRDNTAEDFPPVSKSQHKRPKTHRKDRETNKSVEIFGSGPDKIEADLTASEANNALNTSFGVENASDIQEGNDNDDSNPPKQMFTSQDYQEIGMRSKTPPIESKRHKLQHEPNEASQYHRPIGAKEDFLIEKPVIEPVRNDSYIEGEHEVDKPEDNFETPGALKNKDMPRSEMPKTPFPQKTQPKSQKPPVGGVKSTSGKRKEMLYNANEEVKSKPKTENKLSESAIDKVGENSQSEFGPGISTTSVQNLRSNNLIKMDHTVPISHTSSIRSIPDEMERVTDNLKAKKQE